MVYVLVEDRRPTTDPSPASEHVSLYSHELRADSEDVK